MPYAKKIAKELGLSLQIIDTRSDWIESFDQMVWQLDEPQADLAPINVSNISYHAKQAGIKVLLEESVVMIFFLVTGGIKL